MNVNNVSGRSSRQEVSGKIGRYEAPYEVGDIVFNDGSAMPYSANLTLTEDQTNAAIAVIFYVGTECNNDGDTVPRTLGVGLVHEQDGLAWCTSDADAYEKNITTIQCTASGNVGSYIFTGVKDGRDNFTALSVFPGISDTENAAKYPAWYFAKNYAGQQGSHVSGTVYADGWYLPTRTELYCIWKELTLVDAASDLCGGSQFGTSSYWSSSQYASEDTYAWRFNFYLGDRISLGLKTNDNDFVCAIRQFN